MMMKYFARVERLARTEQLARERRRQHAVRGAAGAVQDQHRLPGRFTDGRVADAQLRHHLAGVKLEILRDPLRCFGAG